MSAVVYLFLATTLWLSEGTGGAPTAPHDGPIADDTLPAGTIVAELVDGQGEPVAGGGLFIEAHDASASGRRLDVKTDKAGRVRVADLPVEGSNQVIVGYQGDDGLRTATAPFQLGPDKGVRVRLVVPQPTVDPSGVTVAHMHVVLERKGAQVKVVETLQLVSGANTVFRNTEGLTLPLPSGAKGPRLADPEKMGQLVKVTADGFRIVAAIPPQGIEVTLVFDVPLEDGRAGFEQTLPVDVTVAQVIATWTADNATLAVDGFPPAELAELQSGLTALTAIKRDWKQGRLRVAMTGLTDGPDWTRRMVALILSVAALALGIALWIRRRLGETGAAEEGP
jgi:hypothetical protein